jgi:hypothetical protein
MVAAVHADVTPLLEALSAADETRVIQETVELLAAGVPPAHIAARVAIPAAWGGGDGHALLVLGAAGRVAEWMRAIPAGPEPGDEERRKLAPALPLVQGFVAVADRVRAGLPEPHPELPRPVMPIELDAAGGVFSALREAFNARDSQRFGSILMGFYRTGTDYRALLAHLYTVLDYRYPAGGHPLIFAVGSSRVLDMADWGDRVPPFIHWLLPLVLDGAPDEPFVEQARAFGGATGHDLAWVQKRLAPARDEAAGAPMRRAILEGDGAAACDAVLTALRAGASPRGVASGLAQAAAERLVGIPAGNGEALLRAAHALLYTNAVHSVMIQVQNPEVYPLLYTAAAAVNAMPGVEGGGPAVPASASTPLAGGLIAPALLRSLEHQVESGDSGGALATARRYVQMGHPPRSLAGILGSAASRWDARRDGFHTLPVVAAAAEEYLTQPGAHGVGGVSQMHAQSALLTAAVRLAGELPGDTALAMRVRDTISARL